MALLNDNLKRWAETHETADFLTNDPVQIPHRYNNKANIEISAFVTAWATIGNLKHAIRAADMIDTEIFEGKPFSYIVGETWREHKDRDASINSIYSYGDFHNLCERLFEIYRDNLTMEAAITMHPDKKPLEVLQSMFAGVDNISDEAGEMACVRLCMFLRWMCRPNSPVDFGLWTTCKPKNLIIPLHPHVLKQALKLGLTKSRSIDILTAIEITDRFVEIFPDDPAKGEFALAGYALAAQSASAEMLAEINESIAESKRLNQSRKTRKAAPVGQKVDDMSIGDVLKLKLFFHVTKSELTEIWDDREKSRKAAQKKGMKLKAHPIDTIQRLGLLEPGDFIVAYAKIIDKTHVDLPRAQRDVITTLGNTAFHKTVRQLLDKEAKNEKKGNKRKRNDQQ